jgi:hypothetical protein
MKLSALITYHYLVYVALALLMSTSKLNHTCITSKVVKVEDMKQSTASIEDKGKVLRSELLYRY